MCYFDAIGVLYRKRTGESTEHRIRITPRHYALAGRMFVLINVRKIPDTSRQPIWYTSERKLKFENRAAIVRLRCLKWHGLVIATCEVLGDGSGFERCAPIVLKTINERGDQPKSRKVCGTLSYHKPVVRLAASPCEAQKSVE